MKSFTIDQLGFIQLANSDILAAVARGEYDLNLLARRELAARGLNPDEKWVGFENARAHLPLIANPPGGPGMDALYIVDSESHVCIYCSAAPTLLGPEYCSAAGVSAAEEDQ